MSARACHRRPPARVLFFLGILLASAVIGTGPVSAQSPPVSEPGGPYSGNEGQPIAFDGTGSFDPDGGVLTYLWDFGDGGTAAEAAPTHTYATGGLYTVTLTVTDPEDLFDSKDTSADVNRTPAANANGPYPGNEGQAIAFSSAGSSDPDGDALTYLWTFGDGATSTAANPSHTYATGGVYTVTLRVTDPDDLFAEDTAQATVNRPPVAQANGPYAGNQGQAIAFSSAGSSDPDGDTLTYLWTFGDGATSTAANPSHTYATGGVYTVTLRVTDPDDLFAEDTAQATVNRPPVANANGPYAANLGQAIAFSSAGSSDPDGQALTYRWDFGDGATSTLATPHHTYVTGGTFAVTLRVTDPDNLFDEDPTQAVVNRPPVANANGPYAGNQGQSIAFSSAGSSDPDGDTLAYLWTFGDGATSTAANPGHTYVTGGTFAVTLRVTDPDDLFDEDPAQAVVNRPPVAQANGPYAGNQGQAIAFSSSGSSDPDGDTLAYLWTFGDGTTSTAANPSHAYTPGGTFTVTLRVTDPGGLFREDTTQAVVNRPPVAEANGPYAGNEGEPITFSSAGTGDPDGDALIYRWSFGDGATSSAPNPSHTYVTGGVYTVALVVTDPGGLVSTDLTSATVSGAPVAEANGPYGANLGQPIAFSSAGSVDPDGQALTYLWTFGDGATSTAANPSHIYATGGMFSVLLRVTDPGGLFDEDTTTATVNRPPVAEANGPYSGNQGVPIAFSSSGSSDPDGQALTYLWTFGDGSTSAQANPSHAYNPGGAFTVTLRVTDPGGLFHEDTAQATVNRPPAAQANGPYTGNEGQPIAFSSSGSSDPDGQALTYLWTFGDGSTSTQANPSHAYDPGGVFTVTLRVTDPGGLFHEDTAQATVNRTPIANANGPYAGNEGQPIAFSAVGSNDPDGDGITYRWSFGDGSTSTAANPTHTYAVGGVYNVTLRVTDPGGLFDEDTVQATVGRTPTANANGPYGANLGQAIAFSSLGSSDPDGETLTYLWAFGDGASSTQANPSHTYATGGGFTATLRVTDPGGLFDDDTAAVTINRPPVANANGPYGGNPDELIAFSSAGSSDPDGQALTYLWTFGDGATSTAANPAHSFNPGGTFTATLRVTDPGGMFDEDTASVIVNRPPVAEANGPSYPGDQGAPIAFSSAGSSDPDGQALTYRWGFGDGTTSTAANPSHIYAAGGTFTVTLRVTDPGALFNDDTAQAVVNRPPVAEAGPAVYTGDRGVPVSFSSAGSSDPDGDALTYHWDFGDGGTSTAANPTHTYTAGGAYTVSLTVRDPRGLIGTDTAGMIVNDLAVTAPAAGAVWSEGSTQTITWTVVGTVDTVVVEYRTGAALPWNPIGTVVGGGATRSLPWQVPDIGNSDVTGARIQVRRPNGNLPAQSGSFTIRNRVLIVTAPNSGDSVYETAATNVTWTSVGFIERVNLQYRLNPGSPWLPIAAGEPDDGSFAWTLPEVTANQDRAQVRVLDAADTLSTADVSSEFEILNRTLVVDSPGAGAVWSEGSTQMITWSVDGPVDTVAIEFRRSPLESYEEIARRRANAGSYSWFVAPVAGDASEAQIRLREVAPGRSDPVLDASPSFTIQNRTLAITAPVAGEEISEHDQFTISWQSAGRIDDVRVEYRLRPADSWTVLAASAPNTGSFLWADTPEVATDESAAQIRVTDIAVGPDLARAESEPFTLVNRVLAPTLPAPGSVECEADTVTIAWTSRGAIPSVTIEWRVDQGSPWQPVGAGVPNTGSLVWSTPDLTRTADQAELRIRQAGDPAVVAVWGPLTLTNRTLAFIRPVGGEVYSEGDAVPVSWSSDCIDSVRVEARIDPQSPWQLQGPGVWPNSGQIIWTVIRVDANQNAVELRIADASDPNQVFAVSEPFTVLNRVLDVVRPTVTDSLSETSTFTIDWDWVGTLQRTSIDYRLDPALAWVPIISNIVNTGTYAWTVPLVDRDYRNAQIRVFDTNNPNTIDEGDPFIIINRAFAVTHPAALDTLTEATPDTIRWSTRGVVPIVTASYRERPGAAWQVIAAAIPNTGALAWILPEVSGDVAAAQVRIEFPDAPEVVAESAPFVILDRSFTVLSPAGGESWSEATAELLRWRSIGTIDSVKIELLLPGGGEQLLFASTPNDGEEMWLVPEIAATRSGVQIRVTDTRPPSASATSAPFTLVNRALTITSPPALPRVEWRIGSAQVIRWTSTGAIDSVAIELGRSGPGGAFETLMPSTLNDGDFAWEVTGPETWNAVFRVRARSAAEIRAETMLVALYDLVPPELCADFDHSGSVSLDELVRIEGIVIGDVAASEADSLAADGTRDQQIDLLDILCGVDEMVAAERAGKGRPFVDAGREAALARGAVVGVEAAVDAGHVPIVVSAQVPLAGLLVAVEVEGGSGEAALGAGGSGLVLAWTATGSNRFTATVRRDGRGDGVPAGTSVPLMVRVRPSGAAGVRVRVVRAEAVAMDASLLPVHLTEGEAAVTPLRVALGQNRPNPFNPVTAIPFELPLAGRVTLAVHDVSGRLVTRLVDNAVFPAGYHTVRWDGRNERGLVVPSGIYLATLRAGGETVTRKMTVIR